MNRIVHILGIIAFLLSVFFLPSAATVVVAILLIAIWRDRMLVIVAGAILDAAFGVPVETFFGFAYFYTSLFILLAVSSYLFERMLIE